MTDDANAFLDRALTEHAAGRAAAARRLCRRALALDPGLAVALHLSGVLLTEQGGDATAAGVVRMRRALRLTPTAGVMRAQLACALLQSGQLSESDRAARQAATTAPQSPDACEALGLLSYRRADYPDAVRRLLRAHRLRPEKTETLLSLGAALRDARLFDAAETVYGAAIKRRPEQEAAWLGRATVRLTRGDLTAGWEDFEHRWKRFPQPPWDGRALNGETLLLHAEQGFGDTIQFARYAPLAADRGARVVLEVHPAPAPLLRRLDPRITVHSSDTPPPPFDLHCPLMSLPRVFATTLENIPAFRAYLTPDPAQHAAAAARLRASGTGLNVGVCLTGNPAHRNDHNRSAPPALVSEFLMIAGARFVSLEKEDRGRRSAGLPPPPLPLDDFAATAAVVAALDVVVTVDTVIAHLAGALGVPCLLLLPYAPDWRWLIDRADTPWYRSLRLIRQPTPGDWESVATAATAVLRQVADAANERANPAS